jgi:hypothetical protein
MTRTAHPKDAPYLSQGAGDMPSFILIATYRNSKRQAQTSLMTVEMIGYMLGKLRDIFIS